MEMDYFFAPHTTFRQFFSSYISYKLQVTCYKLQVTSYKLQVTKMFKL